MDTREYKDEGTIAVGEETGEDDRGEVSDGEGCGVG